MMSLKVKPTWGYYYFCNGFSASEWGGKTRIHYRIIHHSIGLYSTVQKWIISNNNDIIANITATLERARCDCVCASITVFSLQVKLPVIEAAVDNGIVHSGAHCQPHYSQIDLLNEGMLKQVWVELVNQEIDMIGEPANSERTYHHNHHLHHLRVRQEENISILVLLYAYKYSVCPSSWFPGFCMLPTSYENWQNAVRHNFLDISFQVVQWPKATTSKQHANMSLKMKMKCNK